MKAPHSLDEARDYAALYTLGALRGEEARQFEAHLHAGCDVCAAEVEAFSTVAAELAHAVPPELPRPSVRTRVLERIARTGQDADRLVIEGAGLRFVRAARMAWESAGSAPPSGMKMKQLFRDERRGYSTQLVRMAPGDTYPSHRHADIEELYLLEGDLTVSGVLMQAGDYCRAETGSVHSDISTRGGCLFISMSSEHDELLA